MSTFAELKQQAVTLPNRIAAAVVTGDTAALALLEQERATLPAALLAAELCDLAATIAELEAEIRASKNVADDARAAAVAAEKAAWAAQQAHQVALRQAASVNNERYVLREQLRVAKLRVEEIAGEQAYLSRASAAPVQRNLVGRHIPGPVRWPS